MAHYIIRTIRIAHCKRGPERCEQCREMNGERICQLDIDPPQPGMMQRRLIEIDKVWHEFDVVRVFADVDEARAYAAAQHIDDGEWGEQQ